jgi:hypothetical protein
LSQPYLGECEDEIPTPEMGTWESSGTPEILEFDCRGQNASHWGVLYIIGKLLKCRCWKWPHMGHLDIFSTSYGKKKGWESNWQFDSRPLKVGNRPDPDACRWSVTHYWKAFEKSYKFVSDFISIKSLSKKLWSLKVPGIQIGTVSGFLLRSPETKSHSVWVPQRGTKYTIWGKVVAFPKSRSWWIKWNQNCLWLVLTPKVLHNVN